MAKSDMTLRPVAVGRTAIWRGDMDTLRRARSYAGNTFEADLIRSLFDIYLDDAWPRVRDSVLARVFEHPSASKRRKAFIAQLVAEAVAHVGEIDTCLRVLDFANDNGLFDLHWLDRAPTLTVARTTPAMANIRARVEARARGIYDALYGDHGIATNATVLATD